MQIWITFIAMILVIVLGISLFSFLILKNIEDDRIFKNIDIAQNIVLNGEFRDNFYHTAFDLKRIKEFRSINHFLVKEDNKDIVILSNKKLPLDDRELVKLLTAYVDKVGSSEVRSIEKFRKYKVFYQINDLEVNGEKYHIVSYSKLIRDYKEFINYIYIGLIFIVIGFITSKIVASNLAKPLKRLEEYTEKIAKKKWSKPLRIDREDEIGRLTDAMNRMQEALKNADEEEKTFLQSISHDLKTPVMVIESYAQAIIDGVYIGDIEETASTIKYEANRLKQKIKQLLYLNSLNYIMQNEQNSEDIKVNILLNELYKHFRLIRKDINWEVQLEEIEIKGNMEKLRIAFENILDNQIRYAEKNISIKAIKEKDKVLIEIYNDGPNIQEDKLKNIFDSFYKDKKGNFGLGLAICKRIIDFHKGNITVQNQSQGVSFIIQLPIE